MTVAQPLEFSTLELKEVSFGYRREGPRVLDGVSLRIRRGESIGIIGASGAGKSTLGDILLGLLEPDAGEILVNGQPLRLGSPEWWRTVGFVPQTVFLSNDTLLHNIAFGLAPSAIDGERVVRAARVAQLDELIATLPHGLDTSLGDYGTRLSGGQRQRVAIARALYHERQVLVLDEATSSLDTETERAVVRAVASMRGTVTTFIIAHRHSTLESCDLIVEVRGGKVHALATGAPQARPSAG